MKTPDATYRNEADRVGGESAAVHARIECEMKDCAREEVRREKTPQALPRLGPLASLRSILFQCHSRWPFGRVRAMSPNVEFTSAKNERPVK